MCMWGKKDAITEMDKDRPMSYAWASRLAELFESGSSCN